MNEVMKKHEEMDMKTNASKYKRNTHGISSNSKTGDKKYNKLLMLPLVFITAILPFIMRLHRYDTGLSSFSWFSDNGESDDIFLYYKQVYFLIACTIMLLLIIFKVLKDKQSFKLKPILIPISLYGLFALLSTVISKYSSFGYKGIFEQFESIFVILGYCLIIYYSFLFIQTEEDIKYILRFLLISVLVMGLLGLTQILGQNIFITGLAKNLIIPSKLRQTTDLDFTFEKNRVFLTLYNPNYVGVYVSLLVPLFAGLLVTEKKIEKSLFYILALIGLVISMIGSKSKTCIISLFIAALFFIIFFRKYIIRKNKVGIIGVSIAGIAIILIMVLNISSIKNTINTIFHISKSEPVLTNIQTKNDLIITYKGNDLIINVSKENDGISILLKDNNSNIINYNIDQETNSFIINDERFSGIQVSPVLYNNLICIDVKIQGKDWYFTNQTGDNTFYYINNVGKLDKIVNTDSGLFKGYESYASGRLYIWSRTIPLLKNCILLGTGADSFSIVFPQQDYVGKYNYGFDGQILTRPHCMYLQIGVQSGILSLIALLVFYGMYFISSIKLYRNGKFDDFFSRAGVSIFIGTIAYMISGITNDSTITVAPIFWVLIGIGIAINHIISGSKTRI